MGSPCIRVRRRNAEHVRRELLRMDALDLDLRVRSEGNDVLLPLKDPTEKEVTGLGEVSHADFEPVKRPPRTYKDALNLPSELQEMLPSSFDLIGGVCIMKLPEPLKDHSGEIGSAFLSTNRNVRSVTLDRGVKGDLRIRDLEVIAGEKDLETVHVENNLRFKLDPSRVYFSPRLATERTRVAGLVEGGRVLDMFSGIGPFSINCARHGSPEEVVGVDLNPDCIDYFETNIELNSVQDTVRAYLGDAREAPIGMGPFDTVIMNLPHGSLDFLPTALEVIDEGRIHLYHIIEGSEIRSFMEKVLGSASGTDRDLSVEGMREVHNYSPTSSVMVLDIRVDRRS